MKIPGHEPRDLRVVAVMGRVTRWRLLPVRRRQESILSVFKLASLGKLQRLPPPVARRIDVAPSLLALGRALGRRARVNDFLLAAGHGDRGTVENDGEG